MRTAINEYLALDTQEERKNYFDACVNLMDDDLSEKTIAIVWNQYTLNDEKNFLEKYCELHKEKFNEAFIVN